MKCNIKNDFILRGQMFDNKGTLIGFLVQLVKSYVADVEFRKTTKHTITNIFLLHWLNLKTALLEQLGK